LDADPRGLTDLTDLTDGQSPIHRRPAAPDGAGVTGDRRDPKTDTSFDPGLQIPAIVRHISLASQAAGRFRFVE